MLNSSIGGCLKANVMQMQAAGSPPPDLVGDMNAAQEVLQDMDQGCPTQ